MNRALALLAMAAVALLAVGCGREKESDKLAKAAIHLSEEESKEYEFLATKPADVEAVTKCKERLDKIAKEKKEIMEAAKKLPEAEWTASKTKYKPEMDKAYERWKAALKSLAPDMKVEKTKN